MSEIVKKAKSQLETRRTNYHRVFDNPAGEEVLADLATFCRAHESTFHEDPRGHAILEGRREVWLRIQHHLRLSDQELWNLYKVRGIEVDE